MVPLSAPSAPPGERKQGNIVHTFTFHYILLHTFHDFPWPWQWVRGKPGQASVAERSSIREKALFGPRVHVLNLWSPLSPFRLMPDAWKRRFTVPGCSTLKGRIGRSERARQRWNETKIDTETWRWLTWLTWLRWLRWPRWPGNWK